MLSNKLVPTSGQRFCRRIFQAQHALLVSKIKFIFLRKAHTDVGMTREK
jgi:hypothetical protein